MSSGTVCIPEDLRGNLPRFIRELAERRIIIGLNLTVFGLLFYGLSKIHNASMYFVPALVGPVLPAFFLCCVHGIRIKVFTLRRKGWKGWILKAIQPHVVS